MDAPITLFFKEFQQIRALRFLVVMFDGHGAKSILVEGNAAKRLELGAFDIEAEEMNERRGIGAVEHPAERGGGELHCGTLLSLGRYWTTRIIVVPNAPLVRKGPYHFIRHPNYLVVALEIALLPLALGSWPLALGFSVVNALVLAWRIRAENATFPSRR